MRGPIILPVFTNNDYGVREDSSGAVDQFAEFDGLGCCKDR
jgi:hypothetical protein